MASEDRAAGAPARVDPADYVGVQELVHRYADAVVHRDGVQWASCWADDAVWDLGQGRLVEGKDAIVSLWYAAMAGMHAVVQIPHSGAVTPGPDPDRLVGRWYIDERLRRSDGTDGILLAHYDDEYVRVGGRWLFARRFLQPHYMGPPDLSAPFLNDRTTLEARDLTPDV
jgi:hypothetical protein